MANGNIFIDLSESSLRASFEKLAKSSYIKQAVTFEDFMEACLPEKSDATYLLYPLGTAPQLKEEKRNLTLHNIILIPKPSIFQSLVLSDEVRLVTKGRINITSENRCELIVENIWLSEPVLLPTDEQCEIISGKCKKAYQHGGFWRGSDYSGCDWNDSSLNIDVVQNLLANDSPPHIEKAREEISKWKEYIQFRKYYMEHAVKDIPLDDCHIIEEVFALGRKSFNDEVHADYLLDGKEDFKKVSKDSAVMLTKKFGDAEPCYILRLTKSNCTDEDIKMLRRLVRNQLKLVWTDSRKEQEEEDPFNLGSGDEILIKMIQDETTQRIDIYLMLSEDSKTDLKKRLNGDKCKDFKLGYDSTMEKYRVQRQEKALSDLESGNVRLPLLSQYLFAPSTVTPCQRGITPEDINWQTRKNLNPSQKMAVAKALSSSGIFLLQGPPGTGKTTVIAELTAQLVMRGKKVLIASETHKAIDNAFEDIATLNMPEIRLLRLLSNWKKEGNEWAVEKQTENFYASIIRHLEGPAEAFRLFEERKEKFNQTYNGLRVKCREIEGLRDECAGIRNEIAELEKKIKQLERQRSALRQEMDGLTEKEDETLETIRAVEHLRSASQKLDVNNDLVSRLSVKLKAMQDLEFPIFGNTPSSTLISTDIEKIEKEIKAINAPDRIQVLELEKARIHRLMGECMDVVKGIVIPERKEEHKRLNKSLKDVLNQINELSEKGTATRRTWTIHTIVTREIIDEREILSSIPTKLKEYKKKAEALIEAELTPLKAQSDRYRRRISELRDEEQSVHDKISSEEENLKNKRRNQTFRTLQESEICMKKGLSDFFKEFDVEPDYPKDDYAAALRKMQSEWETAKARFEENQKAYQRQKEIHRDIKAYIDNGAVERDRAEMQSKLIGKANVLGMTSTGSDNYRKNGISVPEMDIDVVIIDEVSKCSFLDLLRPMLYGRAVVLVGDHMQLPPMYDLKHLRQNDRQDDYEELDENIINPVLNKRYTDMVESCLFQYMFENIPDSHKTMLTHQYRFHSHIMKINPFYGSRLKAGSLSLDNDKEHLIEIKIRERQIIGTGHHVCFVDCGSSYEMKAENSTSLINEGEANVVVELLKQLNMHINDSNRLSVGVICTYGRQARAIKNKIRTNKKYFSTLMQNKKERLTVSTVDDFQGDERDIIILSMVRNPRNWKTKEKFNLDFIQKFQRINVAITRPRRLLIIVGALEFLKEKAIVTIPQAKGLHYEEAIFKYMLDEIEKNGNVVYLDHIIPTANNSRNNVR